MNDLSMQIEPVSAPIRKQVVKLLRAAITSGKFEPGLRLVEKDLCQMMGVSRPSVREALRELEADGLVVNVPNKGPIVAHVTAKDAAAIYQVRGMLEGLAAKLFTATASDAQVEELTSAFEELAASYTKGDAEGNLVAKNRFYQVLLDGCGNPEIPSILRTMNARVTLLRRLSLSSPDRLAVSLEEIRAIVEAIRKRDPAAAFKATVDHVDYAAAAAMKSLGA